MGSCATNCLLRTKRQYFTNTNKEAVFYKYEQSYAFVPKARYELILIESSYLQFKCVVYDE